MAHAPVFMSAANSAAAAAATTLLLHELGVNYTHCRFGGGDEKIGSG